MAGPGVIAISTFTYRDHPEEFSSNFHFDGDAPSSSSDWRDLCDAHAAIWVLGLIDVVHVTRYLCYEDMDDDSVYTYDLTHFGGALPGAIAHPGGGRQAGDAAAWVRWNTTRRTSHGKPIYIRKYVHGVYEADSGEPDTLWGDQKSGLTAVGAGLLAPSGDWPGLVDVTGDALEGGYLASTWITTRTLKRRGRRPS